MVMRSVRSCQRCIFLDMSLSTKRSEVRVRRATIHDVAALAHHRVAMYRDMGEINESTEAELTSAAVAYFRSAISSGEYVAWVVVTTAARNEVVSGAGLLVRPMIPRPAPDGKIDVREGTIVNVYTEPAWRRQGIAALVMKHVLEYACENEINRVSLHASSEGRPLYETLGFAPTNEMRLAR